MTTAPEAIRLVVWDLDETFWHGTLTEGGLRWRAESEHALRILAGRGIISSICSKNDFAAVDAVLREHRVRKFFVFPSISWDAKGPRLAALIEAVQLRPESVLFIDDNPLNRAEAAHFVPGLQIADETIIPTLLADPRCRGKHDPELTRLEQYRLLERRQQDAAQAGGDTASFLRASNITVSIEHDLEAHLDRAIELINRTNQLNFTKRRLPEDPQAARAELRALLAQHTIQAGLLRVRDDYGDYGFCGLYILRSQRNVGRMLLHFAFSCRILGMGVETWLYRRLERPTLRVQGRVLTDVVNDPREIDWIGAEMPGLGAIAAEGARPLRYVLARGACDMRAVSHYFGMVADRVIEEFDTVRAGQMPMPNHSLIAAQAMDGIDARAIADFAPLGFLPEDFETVLAGDPPPGPAVWLLSFSIEQGVPLYRHLATGALLPAIPAGLAGDPEAFMQGAAEEAVDPALAAHLRAKFAFAGAVPDAQFQQSLRRIFARAAPDTRVFVLLGNTRGAQRHGPNIVLEGMRRHNALIAEAAADFPGVELLSPLSFMSAEEIESLDTPHHFDRMVYFRIFRHIMDRIGAGRAAAA